MLAKGELRIIYNRYDLPMEKPQFMNDGIRKIDYILLYEEHDQDVGSIRIGQSHKKQESQEKARKHEMDEGKQRTFFEENLIKEGLQLEYDRHRERKSSVKNKSDPEASSKATMVYVKVHVPWPVLCRWAETLKIKMPLRLVDRFDIAKINQTSSNQISPRSNSLIGQFGWTRPDSVAPEGKNEDLNDHLDSPIIGKPNYVTMPFQRRRIDKFAISDTDTFFSPTQRMEIVYEVLQRCRNDPDDDKKRGIEALLEEGIYSAAFPLHDGDFEVPKGLPFSQWSNRQRLREAWACWTAIFTRQPYEMIRSYFGEKVAYYFAFLGFYTQWLIFPSITGMCVMLYGTFYTGDDDIVHDICNATGGAGSLFACPVCEPPNCEFEKLASGCDNAEWDYRMDNESTPVMAVLTIIWATVFLKSWKRREAVLAYEWDTYDLELEDDIIRPQYEERAPARHRNFITREVEPYVPKRTRYWWSFLSSLVTFFMLLLVTVALVVLVLARIYLYGVFKNWHVPKYIEVVRILIHLIILGVVMILDGMYSWMAEKLTSFECPRTQTQWLTSFLWKVFIFELVNDFVPIIYAAWVKGRLVRTPLELNSFTEMCEPGGCLNEVTEVIAFLLLGRLVVGNTTEIGIPFLKSMWTRSNANSKTTTNVETESESKNSHGQWHHDAGAEKLELDGVAEEYMEMMVQFAFCTLFVPALPVAPLVCFVNNLLEIRVDAIKFIIHRRPLPIRSPGVQIWNNFLDIVAKLAVICNAGLIAFTSDTLPRLYFKYAKNHGDSYDGFQRYTLSNLSSHYWPEHIQHELELENITYCYYNDYRQSKPPWGVTQDWWETWTIRFAFFGVFLVISFAFQFIYNFVVSDVPIHVRMQIQRRRYVLTKGLEQAAASESSERWLKQAIYGKPPATSNGVDQQLPSPKPNNDKPGSGKRMNVGQTLMVEDLK